jgi:hypothetical protein
LVVRYGPVGAGSRSAAAETACQLKDGCRATLSVCYFFSINVRFEGPASATVKISAY